MSNDVQKHMTLATAFKDLMNQSMTLITFKDHLKMKATSMKKNISTQ